MPGRPPDRRAWWWLISVTSLPLLFVSLTGVLGPDARDEASVALADWQRAAKSPVGQAVLFLVLAIVAVAVVLLILHQAG